MEKSIPEVLREAADLIDEHGLSRSQDYIDSFDEPTTFLCVLTSIRSVQQYFSLRSDPFRYLMKYLGFNDYIEIYQWNDDSAPGEVQRAMREAANAYESGVLRV